MHFKGRSTRSDKEAGPTNVRIVCDVSKQASSKIIDVEHAVLFLAPVRLISKAMYANMLEVRVSWQPLLWPIMVRVIGLGPCFPLQDTKSEQIASKNRIDKPRTGLRFWI